MRKWNETHIAIPEEMVTRARNSFVQELLDLTPKAWFKKKIDKLDFIKIKNFCSARDAVKGKTNTCLEEISASPISDEGLGIQNV